MTRPPAGRAHFTWLLFLLLTPVPGLGQVRPTYELEFAKAVFHFVSPEGVVSSGVSLAPAGSQFQLVSTNDKTLKSTVKFVKIGTASRAKILSKLHAAGLAGVKGIVTEEDLADVKEVLVKTQYEVSAEDLSRNEYFIVKGVDIGVLSLPFKWQLSDGALTAGSTLGLYLGYRQRALGAPSTILINAGLTAIPTRAAGTTGDVDTRWGVTLASGIVFEPVSQVQLGIIAGIDHTGSKSDTYKYNDKGWISFAIGFGFLK